MLYINKSHNLLFNINLKLVMAEENADGSSKAVYRTIFGAEFLWPLDCPDDIIESTVQQIKNLENNQKLAVDKDGLKIAEHIKKFLDRTCEPYWHVFLGNSFGCHSVHEKNRFMYFYYKKIAFLIYKAQ